MLFNRIGNREPALFHQQHGRDGDHGLSHGMNLKNRIGFDRHFGVEIGVARGIERGDLSVTRDQRDDARGFSLIDECLHADWNLLQASRIKAGLSRIGDHR